MTVIEQLREQDPQADEVLRGLEEEAREVVFQLRTAENPRPFCWGVLVRHWNGEQHCTRNHACSNGWAGGHVVESSCNLFTGCPTCRPRAEGILRL